MTEILKSEILDNAINKIRDISAEVNKDNKVLIYISIGSFLNTLSIDENTERQKLARLDKLTKIQFLIVLRGSYTVLLLIQPIKNGMFSCCPCLYKLYKL